MPAEPGPTWAQSYIDLLYDDAHVERWFGTSHLAPERPATAAEAVLWGREIIQVDEETLLFDLGLDFKRSLKAELTGASVEVFIEWNARESDPTP
jgi:hypothetical protein